MKYFLFIILLLDISSSYAAKKTGLTEGWTIGVGIDYPLTTKDYVFSSGKRQSNNTKFTANFEFESNPIPTIEILRSKSNSFGFYFKYGTVLKSNLKGGKIKYTTGTVNATTAAYIDAYNVNQIHIGSLYRFQNLYIPFGINLTLAPEFSQKPNTAGIGRGGGIGYELTVGYALTGNLSAELAYRTQVISYSEQFAVGSNFFDDYGTGTSTEAIIGLKYFL